MSLSQKHSGKVLVPWFSLAEWKAVYHLIYGENTQNWSKALQVLQIWKLRTPLLSAGVEGTLILLEALLSDKNKLTSFELRHIFATSLVRFLNLCAANNDRQGTFYRTAKQNKLPNWLISVRHDIAHSHNLPSQSMLEISLKYCLDWLKPKYWDKQGEHMSDFIVSESRSEQLGTVLSTYINVIKSGNELEEKLLQSVDHLIRNHNRKLSKREIIEQIGQILKEMIRKNRQQANQSLSQQLINEDVLLRVDEEADATDLEKIPNLKKWNKLLNIIYETEVMPNFVLSLLKFCCDEMHSLLYRKVASLWIKEIFTGLNKMESNENNKNGITFSDNNFCMKDEQIVSEMLYRLTPFTSDYIKDVLEYNNTPSDFVEDCLNLMSAFNAKKGKKFDIFTVNDLNLEPMDILIEVTETESHSNSRWILIEDISPFKNVPIGILPHQSRQVNPILDL